MDQSPTGIGGKGEGGTSLPPYAGCGCGIDVEEVFRGERRRKDPMSARDPMLQERIVEAVGSGSRDSANVSMRLSGNVSTKPGSRAAGADAMLEIAHLARAVGTVGRACLADSI